MRPQQAHARNYQDFLIVDVDSHHYENESYKEVFQYIDSPVIRREALIHIERGGRSSMMNTQVGYQDVGGRITRAGLRRLRRRRPTPIATSHMTKSWMDAMGVDYACLFPTPMLFLGLHPQPEIEMALCQAYNRWLCERILAVEPRLISMLYLPFNDPDAAYRTVQEFGDRKGVVGFMVTSPRYKPVHDNAYMKTYALLEEMGKPISFHAAYSWDDRALADHQPLHLGALARLHVVQHGAHDQLGDQRPAGALSQAQGHVDRERPDLGLCADAAARPFLHDAHLRLPLAQAQARANTCRRCTTPRSRWRCRDDLSILEATFKMIKAETQLVWSSDYPHWDFDLPSIIYDLPFLERDRQAQHPRRQCRQAVQPRPQAGEEDPVKQTSAYPLSTPRSRTSRQAGSSQ